MFDFTKHTDAQLEERAAAIMTEMDNDGADLDSLAAEAAAIRNERLVRAAEAARREIRDRIASGEGSVIARKTDRKESRFGLDTVEYRDAWTKGFVGMSMTPEERSALTSAGAVIPTMTVNQVWDRLVKPAELLGRVDVSQFPSYVRFPKATTNNAAGAAAVGSTITESSDVIGYVDLVPNEYTKLLTVGADIDHMAVSAVHDWIVNNLVDNIRAKINADILTGSGSNCIKGITASVSANATALTAAGVTKGDLMLIMATLGSQYHNGAIWVMSANLFFNEVMTLTTLNDYIINDGFQYKLFGHDVILMSEAKVSNKETIFFGDPKAYKVNIFKPLEVKAFETATTTNRQFRGACLADGELLDTSAFVRFAKS